MPSLQSPQPTALVKALLIGDSGTGKTGSLASLVAAGYRVRILDMDNKVQNGILPQVLKRVAPDKLSSVDFEALRDRYKSTPAGPMVDGLPKAFVSAIGLLDKWTDGTKPAEWGPNTVLVIDSLTFLSDAAFNWAKGMNPTSKDPRQWYGAAQEAIESVIAQLTSDSFKTNVIIIAHISWVDRPDGTMKGYPASVGKALGPTIPAYFDNMFCAEVSGSGTNAKRIIRTIPTAMLDLKNPASFTMAPTLPLETGLADFFKTMRTP
jgi:hypothetical protein